MPLCITASQTPPPQSWFHHRSFSLRHLNRGSAIDKFKIRIALYKRLTGFVPNPHLKGTRPFSSKHACGLGEAGLRAERLSETRRMACLHSAKIAFRSAKERFFRGARGDTGAERRHVLSPGNCPLHPLPAGERAW